MHTRARALHSEGTSASTFLVQPSPWQHPTEVCGSCVWDRSLTGPQKNPQCGCRARQAEVCELPTASHCSWEGGDFLFIESFPLLCPSFLMINAVFIFPTNSTLLLEILSLIQISVSESSGKNVFSSWEKTLPFKIPEPRAPPRQHPPAALRHRKNLCTPSAPT